MALVLFLEHRRMPGSVAEAFEAAKNHKVLIYIPAITLSEIGYLAEKNRIDIGLDRVNDFVSGNDFFQVVALDDAVVNCAFQIDDVPELHDRLIAGTAVHLSAPLLTNDPELIASSWLNCIWW